MKIVQIENVISCGTYATSRHWKTIRDAIHTAVIKCDWPAGSGKFTINPERKGNGVVPIKKEFISELRMQGWLIEGRAKNQEGQSLGDFDAIITGPSGPIIAEWETGNIASSHRSLNKMLLLLSQGIIAAGVLVIPSRALYLYLTDRVGNYDELKPYLSLWKSLPCQNGVLEIIVIEHDAESSQVPKVPKGTDGRANG